MNNKGASVLDLIYIMIILFVVAITSIVAYVIQDNINTAWQDNDDISTRSKTLVQERTTNFAGVLDGIILILLVGSAIALVFGAALLPTHPLFMIISVLLIAIIILVAAGLGNVYDDFTADEQTGAAVDELTILPFFMDHYPKMILFLGVFLLVGLFAKTREGGFTE